MNFPPTRRLPTWNSKLGRAPTSVRVVDSPTFREFAPQVFFTALHIYCMLMISYSS